MKYLIPHAHLVPGQEIIKSSCYFHWDQHLRTPPSARGILRHSGFKQACAFTHTDVMARYISPSRLLLPFVPLFTEQQGFRDDSGQGRGSGTPPHVLGIFPSLPASAHHYYPSDCYSSCYGNATWPWAPRHGCLDWSLTANSGTSLRIWNWPIGHEVQVLWVTM